MLSGNLGGGLQLLIFANTYKKEDKQPDYVIYLSEKERDNGGENRQGNAPRVARPSGTRPAGQRGRAPAPPRNDDDGDGYDDFSDPFRE